MMERAVALGNPLYLVTDMDESSGSTSSATINTGSTSSATTNSGSRKRAASVDIEDLNLRDFDTRVLPPSK